MIAPEPAAARSAFLAHAEQDKPYVISVKDAIERLARRRRIALGRSAPRVYLDKDAFSAGRDHTLGAFAGRAAEADLLVVFVPQQGFVAESFVGKEILAFLTGIVHSDRSSPPPATLTPAQLERAARRAGWLLLVDPHGVLTWTDGPPRVLPAVCRGLLAGTFAAELPRTRQHTSMPDEVAATVLASLWGLEPAEVRSRVMEEERRRSRVTFVGLSAIIAVLAAAAGVVGRQYVELEKLNGDVSQLKQQAEGLHASIAALQQTEEDARQEAQLAEQGAADAQRAAAEAEQARVTAEAALRQVEVELRATEARLRGQTARADLHATVSYFGLERLYRQPALDCDGTALNLDPPLTLVFANDSSDISPRGEDLLRRLVTCWEAIDPAARPQLMVAGHISAETAHSGPDGGGPSDWYLTNTGTSGYALGLSDRLARTVMRRLEAHGVGRAHLRPVSCGEEYPRAPTTAADSRVEIWSLPPEGGTAVPCRHLDPTGAPRTGAGP